MNNMSFCEFKEAVKKEVEKRLQEENQQVSIIETVTEKNNGVKMTGLTVKLPGQNVSPTIYLDNYYLREETVDFTVQEVIEYGVYQERPEINVKKLMQFEEIKDKLLPRMVNFEENKGRLESIPYVIIEDLAVYFVIDCGSSGDGQMTMTVTSRLAEKWKVGVQQLYQTAIDNLDNQNLCEWMAMSDILKIGGVSLDQVLPEMYVLTFKSHVYGAAAVLNKKFMAAFVDKIGRRFVLIPSSVHEWIVICCDPGMMLLDEINTMIDQVNDTEVDEDERLSNHFYNYTVENGLCCF